jgi:hypothetical protein
VTVDPAEKYRPLIVTDVPPTVLPDAGDSDDTTGAGSK